METYINNGKRLVLRFNDWMYSFKYVSPNASEENLYKLAMALNAFQSETPEVITVVRLDLVA